MNSQVGVPVVVVTRRQDHVEAVNRTLRDASHAVHCTWLSDTNDLTDALVQINPELLLYFADEYDVAAESISDLRHHGAPGVPLLVVRDRPDEASMSKDLLAGAQDTISLQHRERMQAVSARELRAYHLERALNESLNSAHQYREQLHAFMADSADAIAHVQEGIIVEANPAWAELFGYEDVEALQGLPVMDLFDHDSHTAIKGALVASLQGKWEDHSLKVHAELSDGSTMPLELEFEVTNFDGEPAVRVSMSHQRTQDRSVGDVVHDMLHRDPTTGFLNRRQFIEALEERLAHTSRGGVRALAWLRPDSFRAIREQLGAMNSEQVLDALAAQVREQLGDNDLVGRVTGTAFAVLLERGTLRDCEAWARNLLARVGQEVFEVGERSLTLTCSAGVAQYGQHAATLPVLLDEAERTCRVARDAGGNRVELPAALADDTRAVEVDRIRARQVKAALMENRFKLVNQPIASLQDSHQGLYDILVRMVGEDGEEVLPAGFMPAAERHGLMKSLDRWVIRASIAFVLARQPSRVFVRLSEQSLLDATLPAWLEEQTRDSGVKPARLCFQVTEAACNGNLKQTKTLADSLQGGGFQFAIEHFGIGRDPLQLLRHVPMQYVKIDGSLMQGLASSDALQGRVRELVEAARERRILTIAERVEDANTMAVLFQLGVSYMQGHYVQEPEVILEDSTLAWTLG